MGHGGVGGGGRLVRECHPRHKSLTNHKLLICIRRRTHSGLELCSELPSASITDAGLQCRPTGPRQPRSRGCGRAAARESASKECLHSLNLNRNSTLSLCQSLSENLTSFSDKFLFPIERISVGATRTSNCIHAHIPNGRWAATHSSRTFTAFTPVHRQISKTSILRPPPSQCHVADEVDSNLATCSTKAERWQRQHDNTHFRRHLHGHYFVIVIISSNQVMPPFRL